jgi:septum formation protein
MTPAFHTSLDATTRALILGSTSRYRHELLSRLGVPFDAIAPNVDETPRTGEKPVDLALRLAIAKARDVAQRHPQAGDWQRSGGRPGGRAPRQARHP